MAVRRRRPFDRRGRCTHACVVSRTPLQGPSTQRLLPAASPTPIARPQITPAAIPATMAAARVDSRGGRERSTGRHVPTSHRAATCRAPPSCRSGRRRPPAPAPPPRRRATLLRHQRLPHHPPPRSTKRHRIVPDLRLPAAPGLIGGSSGAARDPDTPGEIGVDGSWTTSRRGPNLVDRTPCGHDGRQGIIRPARRGRDERTAVPPQGGRAPRKGSRALRQEGRPFRKGGEAVRRLHRRRKVSDPLARAGRVPQGAHSRPQGWRVPRKGGAATGSAVSSGASLPAPVCRARPARL